MEIPRSVFRDAVEGTGGSQGVLGPTLPRLIAQVDAVAVKARSRAAIVRITPGRSVLIVIKQRLADADAHRWTVHRCPVQGIGSRDILAAAVGARIVIVTGISAQRHAERRRRRNRRTCHLFHGPAR